MGAHISLQALVVMSAKWAEFMKCQVYPHHTDVDWEEYVAWVSHGGGDDCFQED